MMQFNDGDTVRLKYTFKTSKNSTYVFFGYANPGYDDLVYLMDSDKRIITVSESQIEQVMKPLRYSGYTSTPEWSEDDQMYHGHIDGIFMYICWDAENLEEYESMFHSAVNEYKLICNNKNINTFSK